MKVADLLSGTARRFPDRPALVYGDRVEAFRDLDRRANRVAHALRGLGLQKGDTVALFARNSPEWVEVYFGASKAGIVLVPINFRLKGREVSEIVEHARPSALIFDADLAPEVEAVRCATRDDLSAVAIGTADAAGAQAYAAWIARAASSEPNVDLDSADRHSVCYTSGTTGRAKGAVMTQANVVIGALYMALADIGFGRDDVFLNIAPFCHRAGWPRIVQAVGVGAPQVIVRRFDPDGLFALIERHRVTSTTLVPTMVRLTGRGSAGRAGARSSLRQIVLGGEACPLSVKEAIFDRWPGVELLTVFASTEAGLVTLLGSGEQLTRRDAAGLPFTGVAIRILDDAGNELPRGTAGEVAVRSGRRGEAGVMLEYSRDPEANQAAFHDGWLRTGDAGLLDRDGYLYLTDRKKDMILSGGLNIYSREVERALGEHPAVAEAAVVGRPDAVWGETVVGFVVRRPGADVGEAALVAHCRARLASYKKPKAIRFVNRLPRNAAGKILKYRLRELLRREACDAGTGRPGR